MLRDFVTVIGEAATLRLVQAFGGREMRVPVRRAGRTWDALVQAIGEDAAAKFCDCFQGERLYIACTAKLRTEANRRIAAELRAQGKSWSEVARALDYTERGARKLLEKRPSRTALALVGVA